MNKKDIKVGEYYIINPMLDGWLDMEGVALLIHIQTNAPAVQILTFEYIKKPRRGHDGYGHGKWGYCWNVGFKSVIRKATKKEIEIAKQEYLEEKI